MNAGASVRASITTLPNASDRRWQAGLLALCAVCALLFAMDVASGTLTASEGLDFRVEASGTPYIGRIEGVAPGSRSEIAGFRNGDLVPFAKLDPQTRYRLLSGVYAHEHLVVTVIRSGTPRAIEYTSGPAVPQTRWDLLLGTAAIPWMLLFAALLAWRRPDSPEARALSAFLSLNQLVGTLGPGDWASRWFWFDLAMAATAYLILGAAVTLIAYYAGLFARPLSRLRQSLGIAACVFAAAGTIGAAWILFGVVLGIVDPVNMHGSVRSMLAVSWTFALIALLAAVRASGGAERGRIGWTAVSLTPLLLAEAPFAFAYVVLGTTISGYSITGQLLNVGSFVAPIGMSYALLNRRLLDLGFAFNRAAVYTGVSIVVVGTFMLAEFALSEWLGSGRNANLIAGAILALVLGFSMRSIHARVDRVLDSVFFRKRHEDERAIRALAQEVSHITEPEVIVARVCRLLETHADAASAAIYIVDGAGNYGEAVENDPAIVSLRTWNARVDLHGIGSVLNGEFAYPMTARGRLIGVLVTGPKRSGEPYAPDESEAVAQLARNAGFALDALLLRSNERNEILEAIRQSNEHVLRAIGELVLAKHQP